MKLKIIVGTASDNALYVAQAVQAALAAEFEAIDLHLANAQSQAELLDLAADEVALVCTSTHGNGDVPENLQPLYADLDQHPRYLGGLRYGVIALGDSFYGDTYAAGGRLFDARLQDLGAQRVGDMLLLDASEDADAEAIAAEWAQAWVKSLG
ncbi:nitric oxide synthase [Lampropedia aestuarii]|uniref:Nitric oxide synthase n=1 Tax=Lampropedia aestuarii TaxID=2562762 RepID=A0A4S5BFE1_9BURK|nr:flavodoxin domain-containing protein [Lampropedia aestuarii]MDH5856065.1 flavodoxin domain-containing protein [Lampropedia aestuarii]THJ30709.1 nitric oxide synthase [Lampropedia aestuarii]